MLITDIDKSQYFLVFRCEGRCFHQFSLERLCITDDGDLRCLICGGNVRQVPKDEILDIWGAYDRNPFYEETGIPERPPGAVEKYSNFFKAVANMIFGKR